MVYIIVYVHHVLIIGPHSVFKHVKKSDSKRLTVTDIGQWSYFLGIDIISGPNGRLLLKCAYSEINVQSSGIAEKNNVKKPLPLSIYDDKRPFLDE